MPDETQSKNRILAALPDEEYARLSKHLNDFSMPLRESLYDTDDHIRHVYFPLKGVVSLVTHMDDGASVEVGLVGIEGMVGLPIVLGDDVAPSLAVVQISGAASRIEVEAFREELARGGRLKDLLLRYVQAMMRQVSQTAACNRNHALGERLARWLLMCHDRVEGNELGLTQEFIAQMLGTRRAGVTEAAIILQAAEVIHYTRGHIVVVDRPGLEEHACACYRIVRAEYERLLGH